MFQDLFLTLDFLPTAFGASTLQVASNKFGKGDKSQSQEEIHIQC